VVAAVSDWRHLELADRSGLVWLDFSDVVAMRRCSYLEPTKGVTRYTRLYLRCGSLFEVMPEPSALLARAAGVREAIAECEPDA